MKTCTCTRRLPRTPRRRRVLSRAHRRKKPTILRDTNSRATKRRPERASREPQLDHKYCIRTRTKDRFFAVNRQEKNNFDPSCACVEFCSWELAPGCFFHLKPGQVHVRPMSLVDRGTHPGLYDMQPSTAQAPPIAFAREPRNAARCVCAACAPLQV